MREGNVSQRQGMWLDDGGMVEYGYGTERNDEAAGGRSRQLHKEGRRHGDGSK